ncbi:hypothetical protein GGD55_001614 [Rhizobium giardinii]|uniref:Uncharacterized protein n=1 Tax=Rhizobium giardinii TaxID=56731 RepID=A0A7W8U8R8_9HYPH|nr:hypothetical protein [Rhizobium giardinii]
MRTRDWLSGALEFQAICTKLGFEKINSIGVRTLGAERQSLRD